MDPQQSSAREIWRLIEPVHAVTYFSPEGVGAFRDAGYRGFWMGYFAGRAAPLGPASAELVHALFYNFTFERVAKALPDAWSYAPPEAALVARENGATAALRRHLGEQAADPGIARAGDILARAVDTAPLEGRPLFAANRTLPIPEEPVARLWHFATLLREHRGDGHIAALLSNGITGRQSHVLQSVAMSMPKAVYVAAREFSDEEWESVLGELVDMGRVDTAGALTSAGRAVKDEIEARTDQLAATAYRGLSIDDVETLTTILRPIVRRIVQSGDLPLQAPMGLNLNELLD